MITDIDRLCHSVKVAQIMYYKALDLTKDASYADKMLYLGYVHDTGYGKTDIKSEHNVQGGLYLKARDYEYWQEVYYHGNPDAEYKSFELDLLNYADMKSDSKGNKVTFDNRLKDIADRYGTESNEYINAKKIVDDLRLKFTED